jgi:DNA-binding MarR family transcriptional regulator
VSAIHNPLVAVLHAASSLENRVDARLATVGLSLPKLAALRVLVSAGGTLPLGQLADRLACVKSNVTQLVDRLEAEGLVSRASDPSDRRCCLAAITEEGRGAFERGTGIHREAEKDLFGVLTPEESAELAHLLSKLAELAKLDQRCF